MPHYVDILCFVFRRTNNLLRYFSIDKRKTLWRDKYSPATGVGSPAVPWRANSGVGWEGKMKLRFVKFLTSRGNEIEKREDNDGTIVSAIIPPGRGQSLPSVSLLPPSFPLSPPPVPPLAPPPPQLLLRHGSKERCPPAIPPQLFRSSLSSS